MAMETQAVASAPAAAMTSPASAVQPPHPPGSHPTPAWRPLTRLAFRFCVAYFGLYVVTTQMLGAMIPTPLPRFPSLETLPPFLPLLKWTATGMVHVAEAPVVFSGSGDKILDWIAAGWLLAISGVVALAWTAVDRKGRSDARWYAWFRVFMRFALGATMIQYGFIKVVPLQMPYPQLRRLVEPFGNFSPMGVLWYSIGAAPAYETLVGCAEALGGTLLFFPRTALLGTLVCLADVVEVFALNMTYDVPVKLFSFHLILMSLFLLAPHASRLLNVLVLQRPAAGAPEPALTIGRRRRRSLLAAQVVLGAWLVGSNVVGAKEAWTLYGGGAPRPPLYGLWHVDEMDLDGLAVAPPLTDPGRWRRVIIQSAAGLTFQRMDDTFADYGASLDSAATTLTLTRAGDTSWKATFAVRLAPPDTLTLDGRMDDHAVLLRLSREDPHALLLPSRGFHWVQETPFNR
jgi:hypothetical protein